MSPPAIREGDATPPLWLLGVATALAPFGGSVHVPSLASIPHDLGAPGSALLTVSLFYGMFAAGMIPLGWLSDRYGRRPVALTCLALLALSSLGAAAAPSMTVLLAARAAQGLGAAGILVLARAAVRDGLDGVAATRAMTLVSTLQTMGVALAPVVGGLLGWRAGFAVLAAVAAIVTAVGSVRWVETNHARASSPRAQGGLRALVEAPLFVPCTAAVAAMNAIYFAFLACGPALLVGSGAVTRRGLSAVLLAAAVVGVIGGLVARAGSKRLSSSSLALVGASLVAAAALGFAALGYGGARGAGGATAALLVYMLGNGIMLPAAVVQALQVPREVTGLASSMLGAFQFLVGSVAAACVGAFDDPGRALGTIASISGVVMLGALAVGAARVREAARLLVGAGAARG